MAPIPDTSSPNLRRLIACAAVLPLLLIAFVASAAGDWAGAWQMQLRGTDGRVVLEQEGDKVTGSYPLYGGQIQAAVIPGSRGERLEGSWSVGNRSGRFVAVLSQDRKSFAGRFDDGEWWTGTRTSQPPLTLEFKLATPRETMTAFVVVGNVAESGVGDAWGLASTAIDFGAPDGTTNRSQQLQLTRQLYELISLTTFRYWAIPDPPAGSDTMVVGLEQQPSGVVLSLTLTKNAAGSWQIVMPSEDVMRARRQALLATYGGKPPPADGYRKLQNPRDTMRAFLQGMADWDGRGRELAMSTLDLSGIPEVLRSTSGEIAAQYLRRVLDQVGLVGLQGIPNDGSNRVPYVHFVQGDRAIIIAPSGPAADAPWKFTAQSVKDARELYLDTERLPPPIATPAGMIPHSTFFMLRGLVAEHAPFLLERFRQIEYWQLVLGLLSVAGALLIGRLVAALVFVILGRLPGTGPLPGYFRWSIVIVIALALIHDLPGAVGLAASFREYSAPAFGVLGVVAGCIVGWHLLESLGSVLNAVAERTTSAADDILVTLLLAGARLGVVIAGGVGISYFLSIPTGNLLAGLGIGGLALAFASRETLANVFGAGILVTDRPFRRGDWIKAGDIEGAVESVGVRSTRVRTAQDSVVFIPNGKLVDSTINNLGTRRFRLVKLQLPITGGGTRERLERFVSAVRERIAGDPLFNEPQTIVGVSSVSQGGVFVDISTYVDGRTDAVETAARHALLLDIFQLADVEGLILGGGMVKPAT